jgi:hypothetical protein
MKLQNVVETRHKKRYLRPMKASTLARSEQGPGELDFISDNLSSIVSKVDAHPTSS